MPMPSYHWAHNYVPHETDRKNFAYDSIANPRLSINYSTYILASFRRETPAFW